MKSFAEHATKDRPVLVIGGGVIGVCCAYYLQQSGVPVLLVDAATIGSGASSGNLGLLAVSHSIPLASPGATAQAMRWMFKRNSPFDIDLPPSIATWRWLWQFFRATRSPWFEERSRLLTAMSLESVDIFRDLSKSLGFECKPTGTLEVFRYSESAKKFRQQIQGMRVADIDVEFRGPTDTRDRYPYLHPDVQGAAFYPHDCTIDPVSFVRALSSQLRGSTVVHENRKVTKLRVEHNLIVAAELGTETVEVAGVVLAGGHTSNTILAPLNLHIPMQAARGYTLDSLPESDYGELTIMFAEARLLATSIHGRVRIGGYLHLARNDDPDIRKPSAKTILDPLRKYLDPSLVERFSDTASSLWSGYRPCSPDGLPVIGPIEQMPNLYCATGHGMLGLTLGPITGLWIAAMLTGQRGRTISRHLAPNRFDSDGNTR